MTQGWRQGLRASLTAFAGHVRTRPRAWGAIGAAAAAMLALAATDRYVWDSLVLAEGTPQWSGRYPLRTAVVVAAVIVAAWGVRRLGDGRLHPLRATERLVAVAVTALAAGLAAVHAFAPETFSRFSREDEAVEWASAGLLFVAAAVVVAAAVRVGRRGAPRLGSLALLALAGLLALIGLEEVSWFQRVLEIETPDGFGRNLQGEMNLHNFYTEYTENGYYLGTFVLLVVAPVMRMTAPELFRHRALDVAWPRPFVAFVGVTACGYNFDMWNVIWIQLAFFGSLAMLVVVGLAADSGVDRRLAVVAASVLVAVQIVFLTGEERYERAWEVTEYRELFIPLALLVWTIDLLVRSGSVPTMRAASSPEDEREPQPA